MQFIDGWLSSIKYESSTRALTEWPINSIFHTLNCILQTYGTTCAPMLRQHGIGIAQFALKTYERSPVRCKEHMLVYLRLHFRIAWLVRVHEQDQDTVLNMIQDFQR
jgi:hypothetical protein